jgi:hypothetical protein
MNAFQKTLKRYKKEVHKIDQDLDATAHYSSKPRLQALLTAVGLLGSLPESPVEAAMIRREGPRAPGESTPSPKKGPSPTAEGPPASIEDQIHDVLGHQEIRAGVVEAVLSAAARRRSAYRDLMEARLRLLDTTHTQADTVSRALAAFHEAQQRYDLTVRRIDRELERAVHFSTRPRFRALLAGLGLVGTMPAPPLAGAVVPRDRPAGPTVGRADPGREKGP